jgi:phenylacetate-coenzyme A ligase PaaK-like adenylate-forming protein
MIDKFFEYKPYELEKETKEHMLVDELKNLTEIHENGCMYYKNFLKATNYNPDKVNRLEDVPYFPVRMFKLMDLKSVSDDEIIKTTTSSGTTGQAVSKLYIDRQTAALQQKASVKQLTDFWGKKRIPILVIDTPDIVKNRKKFIARASGVMGMQFFAKEMVFALDEEMNLNTQAVEDFLTKYGNELFVVFGFTFIVWKHLYKPLQNMGIHLDMRNAILMTGGGWKKFEAEGVSRQEFKNELTRYCNITHFLDHYGMAEQQGSIYCECEYGHLHASIFSDVIVRSVKDLKPCRIGEKGLIQVLSVIPRSYPGHSILTEDEGVILGEDDCPCGRKGKYIRVLGRIKNAELRGCSDTYAYRF